jgi:diguanylate cyclase (GGDEF)-like protein
MTNSQKKILYIEDDPEARFLMADIIRYKGYIYYEASRGLDGIRMAEENRPDLILVDLILPDMQGYEVTTHLKNLPGLNDTPVIALTAETQKDVKELVLTAGCDGYISKPINVVEFLFKIEEYLAGKRDIIAPEDEKQYLQKYNIQLVEKLKKKITELEVLNKNLTSLNNELFLSRDELAQYNDRLFYLNNLANYLRTLQNPVNLIKEIPHKIIEGFKVERCILLEIKRDSYKLHPFSYAGISESLLSNFKINFSPEFITYLKDEDGIIWVKNISEIIDACLLKLSKKLKSHSFILANLANLQTQSDSTDIIKKKDENQNIKDDADISKRFFIFIDKGKTKKSFATYEVRILKAFIQTVSVIYENMIFHSRLVKLYKIKEQQAMRDGLTNVYNYRYFIQELQREANRTKRFHTPFSLLMIDIDHFKQYNDQHGHLEGDKILCGITRLIEQNIRTTDTIARYGGEEFSVILPGLNKKDSIFIANKLHEIIESYNFPKQKQQPSGNLTISIGVANLPEDTTDGKILLQLADQALYKAKESGRNKVCII